MALDLQLEALTVPDGTEFPPTVQALLELIAQYESIVGGESFSGINYGPTEPSEDNRDRPWFKTDEDGNPLGWFSWSGAEWTSIPLVIASGPTVDRPLNALTGQLYFDTDINVELIYERSQWRTAAGSPGDVKEVKAATIEEALTNNPGWARDSDSDGMVIIGVSDGSSGFDYNATGGEAEHTLTEAESAPHVHDGVRGNNCQADFNAANPAGILSGVQLTASTGSWGGGQPHNNLPPFRCYWRLVRE